MNFRDKKELEALRIQKAEQCLARHNTTSKVEAPSMNLMEIVEPYREFFLANEASFKHKIKSSSNEKKLIELVRYLFCKYRVCSPLTNLWLRKMFKSSSRFYYKPTIEDDTILWFLCVAQGGSLYKSYSKKYLTKMETHVLLNCKHDLNFEQALVFSVAKTFAKNDGLALRLAHSKISTISFGDFLKTVIYFFAKNPPNSIAETDDLLDFIMFKHRESHGTWVIAGKTLDSLRKKCSDWHFELRRIKVMGNHSWVGAPLPDTYLQTGSVSQPLRWKFTQIKSTRVLAEEGNKMRHCVYSYKSLCMNGQTSIWSLSLENFGSFERKVTIELKNSGVIIQARGLANRSMRPEERHAVQLWARENGLSLLC